MNPYLRNHASRMFLVLMASALTVACVRTDPLTDLKAFVQ